MTMHDRKELKDASNWTGRCCCCAVQKPRLRDVVDTLRLLQLLRSTGKTSAEVGIHGASALDVYGNSPCKLHGKPKFSQIIASYFNEIGRR